jgi:hypothetical protein
MTESAGNIFMSAGQVVGSAGLVVKSRRPPCVGPVAAGAIGGAIDRKLPAMRILMAAGTDPGCRCKSDVLEANPLVPVLMAGFTSHSPMGSFERVPGRGMVETGNLTPLLHGVASFATSGCAVRPQFSHACRELSPMRVRVAICAQVLLEAIFDRRGGISVGAGFVTI